MRKGISGVFFFFIILLCGMALARVVTAHTPSKDVPQAQITVQERASLQRSIEKVYWKHRLWPSENSSPKPSLQQVLPNSAIKEKVADALRKSNALSLYWRRLITGEQLQAEMFRMALDTMQPEVLRELWQALGNQPGLIAESMARPILADRLIRNAYSYDQRFHGKLKLQVAEELNQHRNVDQMRQMSGTYQAIDWIRVDQPAPQDVAEPPRGDSVRLSDSQWHDWIRQLHSIFRHGAALPTGRLSNMQETEDGYYVIAILEMETDRIKTATVGWRKTPFETWWKNVKDSIPVQLSEPDYSYELPKIEAGTCADNTWSPMRSVPDTELLMSEEKDRWVLKHRINKGVVAKQRFIATIDPNIDYTVRIRYDGTNFIVSINGVDRITLIPGGPITGGTVGFKVKSTTGTFQRIEVN